MAIINCFPLHVLILILLTLNSFFPQIGQAQLLAEDSEAAASANVEKTHDNNVLATDDELREVIADILVDNAKLRKQVNSVLRQALLFRNNEAPPPSRDNLLDDSSER